jgi:uncharacterized protein YkwD
MSLQRAAGLLLGSLALATAVGAQTTRERTSESSAASQPRAARSSNGPDLAKVEKILVTLTNRFRRENNRGHLIWNPKLARAAREFAQYVARTGKFSHTADGRSPWDRTAAQGYEDCIIAENIAWELNPAGFTTRGLAEALMKGWEESPEHRKNLLDPDFIELGVGVAFNKDTGRYYAVQDFGRPKSEAVGFQITNDTGAQVEYAVDGKKFTVQPRYTVTHQRCRPPQLTFRLPDGAAKGEVFRPHNGSHYVVERTAEGKEKVEGD